MVNEYREYIEQTKFEGLLFNEKLSPLSAPNELNWRDGFRLLGLAVWRAALREYRAELAKATIDSLSGLAAKVNALKKV